MLLVLRFVAYLAVILIGASVVAFLFTRDQRFMRFAWQVFKYSALFVAIVLALLALERVATL